MVKAAQILVRTLVLGASAAACVACGQRGPLFLPDAPEAQQRATLPQILDPLRAPPPALSPATQGSTAP
ncbi:MAG: lipoprotein [Burkholderiaceae bacterium]|nr:lipoprotein [Burkholderiaceae bacterium]